MKRIVFIGICGLLLSLTGCVKDTPPATPAQSVSVGTSGGVYIIDEGNFGSGNSMVSYYDITSGTSTEDLYKPANGVSLGDVCQSMYLFNQKAYIVVNNSGKVVVANPTTFVNITTINGFTSPRYFMPVSNVKAYVTDLYANAISIVNLSTNTITGSIHCSGWTESMALAYGKAFVTNEKSNKVYVINTSTDVIQDSITVTLGGNTIVEDKNAKLWVLCGGDQKSAYAGLYRINPINDQVEQSFSFTNLADSPWRLHINGTNDTMYFLNNDVFRMAITDGGLPGSAFITHGTHNFYAVGVDPNTSTVYVADAIDYVQRGQVYRYQANGTLINSFLAGIIPGDFFFN